MELINNETEQKTIVLEFEDETSWVLKCPVCGKFDVNGKQIKECWDCGWKATDYQICKNYRRHKLNKEERVFFNKLITDYGNGKIDNVAEKIYNYLIQKKKRMKKCVLCGKEFEGYGNNAQPVTEGYCCDDCNYSKVIPARLKKINAKGGKNE